MTQISEFPAPEIVSKSKTNTSLTVFMPRVNETWHGAFKSENGTKYLRLAVSDHITDNAGELSKEGYGQCTIFGELAIAFSRLIGASEDGNITVRVSAELQTVRNFSKAEATYGQEYFNKMYIVYGFSYEGQYYTTKNGELSMRADNVSTAVATSNERVKTLEWGDAPTPAPLVRPSQPSVNTPPTPEEENWAQGAVANVGGPKRNTRSNPRART